MGARVNDVCYATQAEALDAFYSGLPPVQLLAATSAYSTFVNVSGVWKLNKYAISSSGVWTLNHSSNVPVLTFPSCTVANDAATQFADGMELGWGVAAAMVASWAVWFLSKRLR